MTESTTRRILLIDDDPSLLEVLRYQLSEAGHEVDAHSDSTAAVAAFDPAVHQLVISDLKMPTLDGLGVLRHIRSRSADVPVMMITAFGSIEAAVDAMREGADDYLTKPIARRELQLRVERLFQRVELRDENRQLRVKSRLSDARTTIVGRSTIMAQLLSQVARIAPTRATVLIQGESGTGKELVARALHQLSERNGAAFVAVNCAAIPGDLLEAELFGVAKGAYTGAARARKGKFEQADGGTLLLDEVGEMPIELQAKILRVLQEQTVDVVGGQPVRVDVRVVASTNRDLERAVAAGQFREDLFYRLNVIPLRVPSLRERPGDVAPLIEHFVGKYGPDAHISVSDDLVETLSRRAWPGNVRELENVVARLVLLRESDRLTAADLDSSMPSPTRREPSDSLYGIELPADRLPLLELERALIVAALRKHGGNQSQTARYLEIPRHILLYRIEKFGIERSEWAER